MSENNKINYEAKTYITFIILFCFMMLFILFSVAVLSKHYSEHIVVKLIYLDICIVMFIISYIIKKKERIYWITSYTYNDAKNMEPEKRKIISNRFFSVFGKTMGILIIYLIIGLAINTSFILDTVIFVIGVLYAVIFMSMSQNKVK